MNALVVNDLVGETLEHYGMALVMKEGHERELDANTTSNVHQLKVVVMKL
jgi:hypothetical protein